MLSLQLNYATALARLPVRGLRVVVVKEKVRWELNPRIKNSLEVRPLPSTINIISIVRLYNKKVISHHNEGLQTSPSGEPK